MPRQPARRTFGAALDALPFAIVLTMLAALPSYFNLAGDQIFEEEKSLLFRAAALMALPGVLVAFRRDRTTYLRTPIVLAFLALVVMLGIATIWAIVPADALMGAHLRRHGYATWLAASVLFAAMLPAVHSSSGRDAILRAFVIGAAWPSLYVLLQRAGLDPIQWLAPSLGFKPGSTFGNHVLLGGYLALAVPLTALEAWRSHRGWLVLLVLELSAVAATGSRGAALAVGAALATCVAILLWRALPRRMFAIATAVPALVALMLIGIPALRPTALASQFDPQSGSARVRILIWQDTVDIVRRSGVRALVGHGPESLRSLFPRHYSPEIGYWEQIDAMPDRAHNEFLDTLVSAGIIGALLQLALIAAILAAALRIPDISVRCALAAAIVAHLVESQFGIVSVTARLDVVVVAALVIGAASARHEPKQQFSINRWIIAAALAGAVAPWVSLLPSFFDNPITSGGEEQFLAYLRGRSAAIPFLFAGFFALAYGAARAIGMNAGQSSRWWRVPLLAVAAWVAFVTCVLPSRTEALVAAGRSYESEERWPESSLAFSAAARDLPGVADYQANAARTSLQWAVRSEPPQRDQLLERARVALERAVELDPFDPGAQRNLAAYPRIHATYLQGAEREAALLEADRRYERVSAAAPTLPAPWVEWAWVDVDRGRPEEAQRKVDRALELNRRYAPAIALRARLIAVAGK